MESPDEIVALQHLVPELLINLPDEAFTGVLSSLSPAALTERLHRLRAELDAGSPKAELEANIDPLGLITQALRSLAGIYGMEKASCWRRKTERSN